MIGVVETVAGWLIIFVRETGYVGVFLALAIESACIPISSEIFLLFAGFLTAQSELSVAGVAVSGALGFTTGALLPYYVARKHGRALLQGKSRFFLARHKDLERVEGWFERYGPRAVFVGRLIPVVRDFISLPAGLARMPLLRFLVYTFAGSFPWILGVTIAGRLLQAHWTRLLGLINIGNQALIILLVVLAIAFGLWRWRRKPRRNSDTPPA